MKLWGYYAWHSFLNTIKKIFKSKVLAVIICCMVMGGIIGGGVGLAVAFIEDNVTQEETTEEVVEEEEEEEEPLTQEDIQKAASYVGAVAMGIGLVVFLYGLYGGTKHGSDIFLMADVNFLFAAPMKPQSILLFRLSFQMLTYLLGSIYLLFQVPNLVINVGLDGFSIFSLFAAWVLVLVISRIVNVFSYTFTSTHEKLKEYVLPLVIVLAGLITLCIGGIFLSTGRNMSETLDILCTTSWVKFIPVFGWLKGMVEYAFLGEVLYSLLFLLAILAVIVISCILIWGIKADFFEDAIAGAAKRDALTRDVAEGRNAMNDEKKAKKRSARLEKKEGSYALLKGWGAPVFFHKNAMNRRRFAKFGFLTNTMLTYLATFVLGATFLLRTTDIREIHILCVITAVILFFRNFGNPISVETSHQWLFMVPENPYKKVFYALLSGVTDCAMDLFPGLLFSTIMLQANPLDSLIWFLALVSMDFMYSNFGLLMEALLPAQGTDVVKGILQMMFRFAIILVVLVAFGIGILVSGIFLGTALCILFCLVVGGVCFLAYPTFLHEGIG